MTTHDDADPTVEDQTRDGEPASRLDQGPRLYRGRQVLTAALATLLLGVGAGMAFTTATWVRDAKVAKQPTAVDLGFIRDMLDHHDQAVEMSVITLGRPGISSTVRHFANEVILFQRYEIGLMEGRLATWQQDRGSEDRKAMTWMGMATRPDRMPGMATPNQLERLKAATGPEADRQFLKLMTAHHRSGVDMAEFASREATDDETFALAARMARNQKMEISEYERALKAGTP